jgi:hypothetical protein
MMVRVAMVTAKGFVIAAMSSALRDDLNALGSRV